MIERLGDNEEDDLQYYETLRKEYILLKKNKDRKAINKWKRKHDFTDSRNYLENDEETIDSIRQAIKICIKILKKNY